jgi:exonuclease III
MKILFWNANGKESSIAIKELNSQYEPDIFILAECQLMDSEILSILNESGWLYNAQSDPICKKIRLFTKYDSSNLQAKQGNRNFIIWKAAIDGYPEFNLMTLHSPSKLHFNADDQTQASIEMANTLRLHEQGFGENSIVIGDFNMNPFEMGMISTGGFHAVMCKTIARHKKFTTVQGSKYPMFYNPMWNFFGDSKKGAATGTYYYYKNTHTNYFWHIFDQILIRPNMIDYIDENSINIIESIGSISLLKAGIISKIDIKYSDHLPICITIRKLTKNVQTA